MPNRPFRPGLFAAVMTFAGILAMLGFPDSSSPTQQESPDKTKLVVLVVFDQMRADYLTHWQKLFDKEGFGRLLTQGAWFQNCHYPYGFTLTAAGHASMVTGCTPSKHGIIGNEWYDPLAREEIGAVQSDRYALVPPAAKPSKKANNTAPVHRRQPSVGDDLEKSSKGKAKVVSLSIKDRSAILMAALRATACYWFDTLRGLFVTSTYYRDRLHAWVQQFNKERPADKYFGQDWTRLDPSLDYVKWSGPDDGPGEGTGYKQGTTFPHPMTGGLDKPERNFYEAFTNSPYGNEVLLELAMRAIDAEKLGQRDVCDHLCLSFSSNDLVGHCWGPDSQEVLDITLRSDLIIKKLLNYLDTKVGKGKYVLVLTADHGVAPLAEVAKAEGKEAGRVPPTLFTTQASEFLQRNTTFAPKGQPLPWIEAAVGGWIYLNQGTLKELGLPAAKVQDALAEWLGKQSGIQAVYTHRRLQQGPFADDALGEGVRLSFYASRSGDVAVVLKPYWMVGGSPAERKYDAYRATHGTPYSFDTHVPLLVFGTGVRPGLREERVTPLAAAAILARALDIPPPAAAEYPVPPELFR